MSNVLLWHDISVLPAAGGLCSSSLAILEICFSHCLGNEGQRKDMHRSDRVMKIFTLEECTIEPTYEIFVFNWNVPLSPGVVVSACVYLDSDIWHFSCHLGMMTCTMVMHLFYYMCVGLLESTNLQRSYKLDRCNGEDTSKWTKSIETDGKENQMCQSRVI